MNPKLQEIFHKVKDNQFPIEWHGHLIGKERIKSVLGDEERVSVSPIDGRSLMHITSHKKYVQLALEKSEIAKVSLTETSVQQRMQELQKFKKLLLESAPLIEELYWIECGKPVWEAKQDISSSLKFLDWVASDFVSIIRALLAPAKIQPFAGEYYLQPIGTTFGFLPFSTPLTTFVHSVSASLLVGCPLILCSSSHTSVLTHVLSLLIEELQLPEGAMSIFSGGFKSIQPALRDKRISALMYIGSHEHCEVLRKDSESYSGRQLILQSGGKNAVLVGKNADMRKAVDCTIYGALKSTGQLCTSTSRVFVPKSQQESFCELLTKSIEALKLDDFSEISSSRFMGPLNSQKAVDRFLKFQTMASRESEVLLQGRVKSCEGFFVSPSVHLTNGFDSSSAYQSHVIFCPDIAVYPYEDYSVAIDALNKTESAFAMSYIGDVERMNQMAHEFNVSNIIVNGPTCAQGTSLPLSGRMKSGGHRFTGIGMAMRLSYPQIVQNEQNYTYQDWPKGW